MRSCKLCGKEKPELERKKEWVCGACYRLKQRDFPVSVEMKECSRCGENFPASSFTRDKRNKSGLQSSCKVCYNSYYQENKARLNHYSSTYKKINKDWHNAVQAKRRATKSNATPNWLTEDQDKQIKDLYWLAKDLKAVTGEDYHVDHIVPLKGENVSGLHVPWNLQILPSDLNLAKGNSYGTN